MGRTACTQPQCLYKGALFLPKPEVTFQAAFPFDKLKCCAQIETQSAPVIR